MSGHPHLWNIDSVWLPVEVWGVIVHISDLDVNCVFDHLGKETPWLNSSKATATRFLTKSQCKCDTKPRLRVKENRTGV